VELEQQSEESQALAEELEESNEQLLASTEAAEAARLAAEQANRAKSEFLTMMSHELRTPLNAIAGYTELLDIGVRGPVTPEQREDLGRITRAQRHLLSLINDLLNFARLDAGRVQFRVEEVRLARVFEGVEPLVGPLLQARNIAFAWDRCDPTLTAWTDDDKVQQVLVNLLSNAAKFTPEGGEVRVWCDASPREVTIYVRDNGVGIPAERLTDVFDPFVQVGRSPAQPLEGTGLGLAISREIVRALGGRIWVESEVGVGSTFAFTLPRERRADVPAAGGQVLLGVSPPAVGWPMPTPVGTPAVRRPTRS
jgi:signal transduction histidine kinase